MSKILDAYFKGMLGENVYEGNWWSGIQNGNNHTLFNGLI